VWALQQKGTGTVGRKEFMDVHDASFSSRLTLDSAAAGKSSNCTMSSVSCLAIVDGGGRGGATTA
jgi:hypothetical protein